tara:strand:- start:203 stop:844 length:642 start_codon:yes stop_codon:yes gene_type:complete
MTNGNQTQHDLGDLVLLKRFGLGLDSVSKDPRNSSYALDALDFYQEGLDENISAELRPWISGLRSDVQRNGGRMADRDIQVFDRYSAIFERSTSDATIGQHALADRELGYNGYIPEEILGSNANLTGLTEQVKALDEERSNILKTARDEDRELSDTEVGRIRQIQEADERKLYQAFQIVESAGNHALRYRVDNENYEKTLKQMYPEATEQTNE